MHERILHLVAIKANGNKSRFAEMIGWKKQHMTRVTKEGGSIGLAVVERILLTFPDVNARWLITGEGEILTYCPPILDGKKLSNIEDRLTKIENKINTVKE